MLLTFFLSKFKLSFVTTGLSEDSKREIILSEGLYKSCSITCKPLPASATPSTKRVDAPFPIPMHEILDPFDFSLAIVMTPSVLDTEPSVSRNINLGYPSIFLLLRAF